MSAAHIQGESSLFRRRCVRHPTSECLLQRQWFCGRLAHHGQHHPPQTVESNVTALVLHRQLRKAIRCRPFAFTAGSQGQSNFRLARPSSARLPRSAALHFRHFVTSIMASISTRIRSAITVGLSAASSQHSSPNCVFCSSPDFLGPEAPPFRAGNPYRRRARAAASPIASRPWQCRPQARRRAWRSCAGRSRVAGGISGQKTAGAVWPACLVRRTFTGPQRLADPYLS